jgi:SWI/SNF-related matrix-associated actin-dependent regulator of chromatin subfamily D
MEMQEFERRLDATITRKTLDIQDALAKPPKRISRTLRIFLSNTSENQSEEEITMDTPSWTFKIQGLLLDVFKTNKAPNTRKQTNPQPKFSSFFSKIGIEIQRDQIMQGNLIQWQKLQGQEIDGFEVKRRGDQDVDLKILLFPEEHPEKHKLSPPLSQVLDITTETLPNVITSLWQYIKSKRLQDPEDRRVVVCDEKLLQVFGTPKIMFPNIPELLARHLFPCDPIVLNYTVWYL